MLSDDDRELLRLAAIACGELHVEWVGNDAYFDGVLSRWSPLTDDGDALRLAVRLAIAVFPPERDGDEATANGPHPDSSDWISEPVVGDPYAATRRAIVRAAAEIGRQHD